MHALVLNLDRDLERYTAFLDATKDVHWVNFERVPAVYGRELPAYALAEISKSKRWAAKRGEIGCFLSHIKAWEIVAKYGARLILEDDAVPVNIDRLADLVIPDDVELLFVNDRAAASPSDFRQALECRPIRDTLATLERTRRGVGGDGYVLFPSGAQKMLEAVEREGCFGHVDWRMLRYGISREQVEAEFPGTRVADLLTNHHHPTMPPQWGIVNAMCLNFPVVAAGVTTSSRENANV